MKDDGFSRQHELASVQVCKCSFPKLFLSFQSGCSNFNSYLAYHYVYHQDQEDPIPSIDKYPRDPRRIEVMLQEYMIISTRRPDLLDDHESDNQTTLTSPKITDYIHPQSLSSPRLVSWRQLGAIVPSPHPLRTMILVTPWTMLLALTLSTFVALMIRMSGGRRWHTGIRFVVARVLLLRSRLPILLTGTGLRIRMGRVRMRSHQWRSVFGWRFGL